MQPPLHFGPPTRTIRDGRTAGRVRSSRTLKRVTAGILVTIGLLLIATLAVLLTDANILRRPISNYVSHKLDRPFAINGDLRIGGNTAQGLGCRVYVKSI